MDSAGSKDAVSESYIPLTVVVVIDGKAAPFTFDEVPGNTTTQQLCEKYGRQALTAALGDRPPAIRKVQCFYRTHTNMSNKIEIRTDSHSYARTTLATLRDRFPDKDTLEITYTTSTRSHANSGSSAVCPEPEERVTTKPTVFETM